MGGTTIMLMLAAAAVQAGAPDWQPLTDSEQAMLRWDSSSVTRRGDTTIVAVRLDRLPATTGENAYAVSQVELRCSDRQARIAATVNYSGDGTAGKTDRAELQFQPIADGTPFDALRMHVCR